MSRCALFALLFLPLIASGADWRTELTPSAGTFPLPRPLTARYEFGWTSFTAGEMDVAFTRAKNELHLEATGKTTGLVRAMWRLDVTHHARADATTLLPASMRQREVYSSETLRTDLDFTPEKVVRLRVKTPADKNPPKAKTFKLPNLRDLHSALLFTRSQPLKNGDSVSLTTYPTTGAYLAYVKVLGRETVQVPAGKYPAIKVDLKLQGINKKGQLEPHTKFKSAQAWISDDPDRLLLKISGEIFVGSVWAELQSVKFAGK